MEIQEENLCLTINDHIDLGDGLRLPYNAVRLTENGGQRRNILAGNTEIQEEISSEIVEESSSEIVGLHVEPQIRIIYEDELVAQSSSGFRALQPLPPGKNYHVFFSHSSEDREWVFRMVTKLESAEYGFKCCFADRDFDIGAPVLENITKYINLSKKTAIVLTPEFLESGWCSYETRITMEMDLDTRQRLLVPVMLRNCKVPEIIGRLSYIEVDNDHFLERLVQTLSDDSSDSAFNEAVGSAAIMAGGPFHFNPNFFNTDIIEEVTVYVGCGCCTESSAAFVPNALMHHGLQLTEEEYNEIVKNITGIFYVRCRGLHNKGMFWACLLLIQSLLFPIVVFIQIYVTYYQSISKTLSSFSCWPLIAVVMIVIRLLMIRKAIKTLSMKTVTANKIAIRRNMMIIIKDHGCCYCACDRTSIIFMYYDWRPCHTYLKTLLLDMEIAHSQEAQVATEDDELINPTSVQLESPIITQEMIETLEDRVDNLLFHHATEYSQLVLSRRTKNPSEQRHTRQKECLCQFVESILQSKESSCFDRLYGGPTRHPWRQLIEF